MDILHDLEAVIPGTGISGEEQSFGAVRRKDQLWPFAADLFELANDRSGSTPAYCRAQSDRLLSGTEDLTGKRSFTEEREPASCLTLCFVLGIMGAVVGNFAFGLVGITAGCAIGQLIGAAVAALILLCIAGLFRK